MEEVIAMKNEASMSGNSLEKILRILRLSQGRKFVQPRVRESLIDRKAMFSDIYTKENIKDFDDKHMNLL